MLAALALTPALAACTDSAPPVPTPPVDPDVALREAAVVRERALLAAYDALLAASPEAAARLAPLRAEHEAHLAALGGTAVPAGTAPPATPVAAGTVADLVRLERETATAHAAATVPASPGLAALLAQLAASEASHPVGLA